MGVTTAVMIGYANDDVHFIQVMENQDASEIAVREAQSIGTLTNAGFRTIVAAVWLREETKSAGLLYAANWDEADMQVLLHNGDRIASSHALYERCSRLCGDDMNASDLLQFCLLPKIDDAEA